MDFREGINNMSINIKRLDDTNYRSWKIDMKMSLNAKGVFTCVDTVNPEVEPTADQETAKPGVIKDYKTRASMALAMIYLAMEPDQKILIRNCATAREAWTTLMDIYEPKSRSRIGKLRKDFVLIHMLANETMAKYLSRVENAVLDLAEAGKTIDKEEHAYQILTGLTITWDSVIERLYALSDPEFIPKVLKERLLSEYDRRTAASQSALENSSTLVLDAAPYVQLNRARARGNRRGRGRGSTSDQFTSPAPIINQEVTCYNCQGRAHYSRDCPSVRLSNGSRGSMRGRRNRGRGRGQHADMQAMFVEADLVTDETHCEWAFDSASTHHFCRIKSWFHNFQSIAHQSAATADGTTIISGIGDVHFKVKTDDGMLTIVLKSVYYAPNMRRNLISGRLVHEQGYRLASDDAGYFLRNKVGRIVMRAPLTNKFFTVTGEVIPPHTMPEVDLQDVDPIEQENPSKQNADISQVEVSISRGRKKKKKMNQKQKKAVSVSVGSHQEKPVFFEDRSANSSLNEDREMPPTGRSTNRKKAKRKSTPQDVLKLWHDRFAHVATSTLVRMSREGKVRGLPLLEGSLDICDECKLGKATHAPHKRMEGVTTEAPMDLVFSDVWGPSSVASIGGARYFISFTDDYSRKTYVYVMKTKDEAFAKFKLFLAKAERSTGRKLKRLRVDNGMEYCAGYFQEELNRLGIRCERTNIYSPQMNGVAERLNRTLLDAVRTTLLTTKLSSSWWAELLTAAAYVKNKTAHAGINFDIPDARFYDVHPGVTHLKRLGSVCFMYDETRPRSKLQPRAKMGILVGYAINTKGYRVWCPDSEKTNVRETLSVRFDEQRLGMDVIKDIQITDVAPFDVQASTELNPSRLARAPIMDTRESYVEFYIDNDDQLVRRDHNVIPQAVAVPPNRQVPAEVPAEQIPPRRPVVIPNPGWRRETVCRLTGPDAGRYDVYYRYLEGRRMKSVADAGRFCLQNDIPFDETRFDFSIKNIEPALGPPLLAQPEQNQNQNQNQNQPEHNEPLDTAWREETINAEDLEEEEEIQEPEVHCLEAYEPGTYQEAISSPFAPKWKAAMEDEMITLKDRKAYTPVASSPKIRTVGSRWVYTLKRDAEGKIARYRARLVAQGHTQRKELDYHDTYSPVVNFTLVRFFFILFVIGLGWLSSHLDIKCAYFYGDLDEEIYMRPPLGFGSKSGFVWRLHKAMYGLKQSGRQWYIALDEKLRQLGFIRLSSTNCVYMYHGSAILLVYVDDLIIFAKDKSTLDKIIKSLADTYRTTNLGQIRKVLGVEFIQKDGYWFINQTRYIDGLAKRFDMLKVPNVLLPLDVGAALRPCPEDVVGRVDSTRYRSLIGAIMFLALRTRPDMLHATVVLAQFSSNPSPDHWRLLLRLLAYAYSTKNLGIRCSPPDSPMEVIFYSDSSWASCLADRKSWSGYIGTLCGIPFSWRASKQKCVALSTMEAEFVGLTATTQEVMWLTAICKEMFPIIPSLSRKIMCDNQSAIAFAKDNVEHSQTKHIDLRLKFVRDVIQEKVFDLRYINTRENLADVFTKPLPRVSLDRFKKAVQLQPMILHQ
jgi:transposase InsO family protein